MCQWLHYKRWLFICSFSSEQRCQQKAVCPSTKHKALELSLQPTTPRLCKWLGWEMSETGEQHLLPPSSHGRWSAASLKIKTLLSNGGLGPRVRDACWCLTPRGCKPGCSLILCQSLRTSQLTYMEEFWGPYGPFVAGHSIFLLKWRGEKALLSFANSVSRFTCVLYWN